MTFRVASAYMVFVYCLYVPWARRRADYESQHPFAQKRVPTSDGTAQLSHHILMNSIAGQMGFQPPFQIPRGLNPVAAFSPLTPFVNSRGGMFVPMSSAPITSKIKKNANKEVQDIYASIDAMYVPYNKIYDTKITYATVGE